jgi:nitrogen fixation protein NifU and related proteins
VSAEALYHEALVRLARAATGAGRLEAPEGSATLDNPLCGDRVTFEVRLSEGRVAMLAYRVRGCLLCQAAASLLGRAAAGATPGEVAVARAGAAAMLESGAPPPGDPWADLELFVPVRGVASRHGCVLLPFDALGEALAHLKG